MGDRTGIEWTDATWNPIRGCSRVSAGCQHCYAETVAARFSGVGQPYHGLARRRSNGEAQWTGKVEEIPEKLIDPIRWQRPRRIFVNSMSDLFHEALPDEAIDRVLAVMVLAIAFGRRHVFQVLTKRAWRMRAYFDQLQREGVVERLATAAYEVGVEDGDCHAANALNELLAPERNVSWPLPNLWLGVSVENQSAAVDRIWHLVETPAVRRFLSCEPLLGPVYAGLSAGGVHWVIAGGESGKGARPMELDWARGLRDECRAAGVPFFLKQLGGHPDKRGGAAAVLDGETWTQMPPCAAVPNQE